MFKYLPNENIAYGFSPAGAVDFWYNEKAAYQEVAAQFDLPTDEIQIDANAIYMKIGAEAFAKVGHYLQMMDNKATALSVAYDPSNAMSEAAFIHTPVTSAVTTSALAYRLRQGAGATTTRADVKSKADEVASLKVDKSNQESQQDPSCAKRCGCRKSPSDACRVTQSDRISHSAKRSRTSKSQRFVSICA